MVCMLCIRGRILFVLKVLHDDGGCLGVPSVLEGLCVRFARGGHSCGEAGFRLIVIRRLHAGGDLRGKGWKGRRPQVRVNWEELNSNTSGEIKRCDWRDFRFKYLNFKLVTPALLEFMYVQYELCSTSFPLLAVLLLFLHRILYRTCSYTP